MSKKGKVENVRASYVQSALSGFGTMDKRTDEDGSGKKKGTEVASPFFWQQEKYVLYVPVVITKIVVSDTEYRFNFQIPLDLDVPLAPYKPKSKNLLGQAFSLAKEKSRDSDKLLMVYGVSEKGSNSLPPASISPIRDSVPYIFSRVLGFAHRACECLVQFSNTGKKLQKGVDDTGQREGEPPAPDGVGGHQETTGGSKVRSKIRDKGQAEGPSVLDEGNGQVLGLRQSDGQDKLGQVQEDNSERERTKGHPLVI